MDFRLSQEEEAFKKEVQDFIAELLPEDWLGVDPDGHSEQGDEELHQFELEVRRKLAARGWLGLQWPKQHGGQEASMMRQFILEQELIYSGVPYWALSAALMTGDMVLQFGTEEQKRQFLPPIAHGEVQWLVGMSEPNAGSDLANLQLRAVEQEDCFVLNGQKTWQTGAHYADWAALYARTDPNVKKNRGITTFLVDLKTPGISMRRIEQMTGHPAFCEVFYDNVKVPKENVLGAVNGGWGVALYGVATEKRCWCSIAGRPKPMGVRSARTPSFATGWPNWPLSLKWAATLVPECNGWRPGGCRSWLKPARSNPLAGVFSSVWVISVRESSVSTGNWMSSRSGRG
jgi:alkylation response protein AidB-like acyl-CoA dehydrogenase